MKKRSGCTWRGLNGRRRCRTTAMVILCLPLVGGCASPSTVRPTGAPAMLPTEGVHADGQLAYTWHQDHTSPEMTPSRYSILVNGGWQPKQVSADSIAK